ncbi:hypothetical protein F4680DRAFT_431394 [Xylaria scruposa]|nr:hypothetical protein F4680DRAFT_431394 [Xylaria scruposa]
MAALPPPLPNPSRMSMHEVLGDDLINQEPLQWGEGHLDLFHCTFSILHPSFFEKLSKKSADISNMEQQAQPLATGRDPDKRLLAIRNLLGPYVGNPPLKQRLCFNFDFDICEFQQRFPIHGLYILSHMPISICFLDLNKVDLERRKLKKKSLKGSPGSHHSQAKPTNCLNDPFITAAAIAVAQRLALHELYPSTTPSFTCSCRYYRTRIIAVTDQDHKNLHVYTTTISSAMLELVNFPYRRPARCENNACYNINFQVTSIPYEPYESLEVRLLTHCGLKNQRRLPMGDSPDVVREWYDSHRERAVKQQQSLRSSNASSIASPQNSDTPAVEQQQQVSQSSNASSIASSQSANAPSMFSQSSDGLSMSSQSANASPIASPQSNKAPAVEQQRQLSQSSNAPAITSQSSDAPAVEQQQQLSQSSNALGTMWQVMIKALEALTGWFVIVCLLASACLDP